MGNPQDPSKLKGATIQLKESSKKLPVTDVVGRLTTETGPQLEIMSRTTPRMVEAAQVGFIYSSMLSSTYVSRRIDQILRLGISASGAGRSDMIEALRAGGAAPDSFYKDDGGKGYNYIREID